jgi:hypothetical protein
MIICIDAGARCRMFTGDDTRIHASPLRACRQLGHCEAPLPRVGEGLGRGLA